MTLNGVMTADARYLCSIIIIIIIIKAICNAQDPLKKAANALLVL